MSDFKVFFNGVELTKYIRVTSLDRGVGTDVTNELIKIGSSNGKYFKSKTTEEKIISMGFVLRYDLTKKRRELAGLLNVSEPAKLIFSDEPDKYYMAISDGDIPLDENNFLGKGTIEWLVPEGIAWSVVEKEITDTNGAISFNYDGTAETFPRFEIENPTTNGFLGIVNQDGKVIQIGDPDETDTVPYQRSERVINEHFRTASAKWVANIGARTYPNYLGNSATPNVLGGSFDWTTYYDTITAKYPANSKELWAGTNLNQLIKKTSEGSDVANYQVKCRVNMWQDNANERGRMELIVQNGTSIGTAIVLRDSTASSKQYTLEMWVKGVRLYTINLGKTRFKGHFFELEITRVKTRFTFKISAVKNVTSAGVNTTDSFQKTFNVTDVGVLPATSVTIGSHKFSNKPVNRMHFAHLTFDWMNVDKIEDVPNSLNAEDVIEVDNNDCSVLLNGALNRNLSALGNVYFPITLGLNQIQFAWSDWAEKPTFKMFYREGWE